MGLIRKIRSLFSGKPWRDRRVVVFGSKHEIGKDGRIVFDRSYEAGSTGRMRWMDGTEMSPTPSESDLREVRGRTLELERNDSIAMAAVETKASNIATHRVRPQSMAYGDDPVTVAPRDRDVFLSEERMEVFRSQIEASWAAYSGEVDATGAMPWEAFAWLAARTRISQGEVFVHKVSVPLDNGRRFRTAYEMIEPGRVSTPHGMFSDPSVIGGIKHDAFGRPVEYYVWPSSSRTTFASDSYKTIPARDIYHLHRPLRPGQRRALPDLSCVLQSVKDRKDLADATIIKAQNSAAITAIIHTQDPGALEADWSTKTVREGGTSGVTYETVPIQKGQLMLMPHTDNVSEFKSDHPTNAFEPFMQGIKGDIARGVGISYLSLTRDVSGANFSTMKGVMLQDRLTYQAERLLLRGLLSWIYANHCDEAVLSGWVDAPCYARRRSAYIRVAWQFAPWGMVEPVKEINGAVLAINNNLASRASWAQSEGEDAEEIIDSNLRLEKYERERRDVMGLPKETVGDGLPEEKPEPEEMENAENDG